ncbi:hypothetical protein H4R34_001120 [Dimargaris verticillata]|uniref:Uncharacterized protein n=1 Tax=Dimargaris verticillata TaxID=2761393 RepID=A0A9W8B5C9_9FUNG|nr:hypothetical protein H4R34_001120 [Dimargaris verticillata]
MAFSSAAATNAPRTGLLGSISPPWSVCDPCSAKHTILVFRPTLPNIPIGTHHGPYQGNLAQPGVMAMDPALNAYLMRRLTYLKSELPRVLNEINELEQLLGTPVSVPHTPTKPSQPSLDVTPATMPALPSQLEAEPASELNMLSNKCRRRNSQLQEHQHSTLDTLAFTGQHASVRHSSTPKML